MDFLNKYGIEIKNKKLLNDALTHSSYANEHDCNSYERLEYLGDAVLQLIVSEYLYVNESLSEGQMSKKRASFVCEEALYEYYKDINYFPYIKVGKGQLDNITENIVADIFEAILGCIYLDQGFNVAKEYIYKIVIPYIKKNHKFLIDYKSKLQEEMQMEKKTLDYVVVREDGPAHDKVFEVVVTCDGMTYGHGIGKTKKEAEQQAARDAFRKQAK